MILATLKKVEDVLDTFSRALDESEKYIEFDSPHRKYHVVRAATFWLSYSDFARAKEALAALREQTAYNIDIITIEHHGKVVQDFRPYPCSFETKNEHWIVNGKRFDHYPTEEDIKVMREEMGEG